MSCLLSDTSEYRDFDCDADTTRYSQWSVIMSKWSDVSCVSFGLQKCLVTQLTFYLILPQAHSSSHTLWQCFSHRRHEVSSLFCCGEQIRGLGWSLSLWNKVSFSASRLARGVEPLLMILSTLSSCQWWRKWLELMMMMHEKWVINS